MIERVLKVQQSETFLFLQNVQLCSKSMPSWFFFSFVDIFLQYFIATGSKEISALNSGVEEGVWEGTPPSSDSKGCSPPWSVNFFEVKGYCGGIYF